MKKTKKQEEYYGGRIKSLVETVVLAVKQYPEMLEDTTKLHTLLKEKVERYGDPKCCFNCRRSMKITGYVADVLDAVLILKMAEVVRDNVGKGMTFTQANKVHIPSLKVTNAIVKRQTKCDYLGLIKQPPELARTGYWVLTSWAWRALQGHPIPRVANYWDGRLISRSEEQVTLSGMFSTHVDLVRKAIALRKNVRSDYVIDVKDYHPQDWANFSGVMQEEI